MPQRKIPFLKNEPVLISDMSGRRTEETRECRCEWFSALEHHPQLLRDLECVAGFWSEAHCKWTTTVKPDAATVFVEPGIDALVALNWYMERYQRLWPMMPGIGDRAHLFMSAIMGALVAGQGWDGVTRCMLGNWDSLQGLYTRVLMPNNKHELRKFFSWPDCPRACIVHYIYDAVTLPDLLDQTREAWATFRLWEHINPPLGSRQRGPHMRYDEHVEVYAAWHDWHCIHSRTTSSFIQAVANGDISIRALGSNPSWRTVQARLQDARAWLEPLSEHYCSVTSYRIWLAEVSTYDEDKRTWLIEEAGSNEAYLAWLADVTASQPDSRLRIGT